MKIALLNIELNIISASGMQLILLKFYYFII